MLNHVALVGRLTADPELRSTPNGLSVCSFTLAVNRSYVKQGEERQADFIECVAWRNTAESLVRYTKKGSLIAVSGSIQTRTYKDKDGNNRKSVEVQADDITFCEKSGNGNGNGAAAQKPSPKQKAPDPMEAFTEITDDEDLPF